MARRRSRWEEEDDDDIRKEFEFVGDDDEGDHEGEAEAESTEAEEEDEPGDQAPVRSVRGEPRGTKGSRAAREERDETEETEETAETAEIEEEVEEEEELAAEEEVDDASLPPDNQDAIRALREAGARVDVNDRGRVWRVFLYEKNRDHDAAQIHGFPKLREVWLLGSRVTPLMIQRLREAFPDVRVYA